MAIERIVIVGGGAAGWITAGYLHTFLNRQGQGPEVAVIESDTVGRLGVGEATVPTLRRTISELHLSEHDFMRFTHATFKHGIRFDGWSLPGGSYFHPFEAFEEHVLPAEIADWAARRYGAGARPFAYEFGVQAQLADAGLSPKPFREGVEPDGVNYAYHVDALLLGDFLSQTMIARGVRHIRDTVVDAVLDGETGHIASVTCASGQNVAGDFFVDCSGFASLLTGRAQRVPFRSFSANLLCNAAIAGPMPLPDGEAVSRPFTIARALEAGWIWDIGLQHRKGRGYVFSADFLDPQEAERRWREETGAGDDMPCRLLRFEPGHREQSWTGNCVAIGLAGGFVEPLESTGIMLIELAARLLARLFPVEAPNPAAQRLFNTQMASMYGEIRDFLVLHYCLSQRRDSAFWHAATAAERIPDSLAEKLELWQGQLVGTEEMGQDRVFSLGSWQSVFYGMDNVSAGHVARARRDAGGGIAPGREARRAHFLRTLPSHAEYLAQLGQTVSGS